MPFVALEDLHWAWQQIRQGSRSAGVDGVTVDAFAKATESRLANLYQQLVEERYAARPALGLYLPKRQGGKRLIGIPTVRDRIVQRLLLEEMYLPLEQQFLDCSYAYRPGRNIQMAVRHLDSYYQFQPTWVIKADIRDFFDSICWALLMACVDNLQLAASLQTLVEAQVKAGIVVRRRYFNPGKGVVQGAILSGALANLYLSEFDRFCLQNGANLVRYGDDFAIVCYSPSQAQQTLQLVREKLRTLYLELQPEKTHIYAPDEEFTFLGYRFYQGNVYAPEPVVRHDMLLDPSGNPIRRTKKRSRRFVSQPPKGESQKPTLPLANNKHLWSAFMSTLYITDQGSYLRVKQGQFQVMHQHQLRFQIPVNRVSHILLFGCCNLSHGAVKLALRRNIPVLFLSYKGKYFGRLSVAGRAKVEYVSQQVERAQDGAFIRQQAATIVRAKLHNCRVLLMRLNRRRRQQVASQAIKELAHIIKQLSSESELDVLRGYEGQGTHLYFRALGSLFSGPFVFEKRTKRPPTDPINSLLSLGYTLLHQNLYSFIQASGLHPHFGNLHTPRNNHPALVSDLMEEFRALVVDSLVTYLVNKQIFLEDDFTAPDERGGVFLQPGSLKKFLKHWQERLQMEVTHTPTGYKVAYRRCLELQVREYIAVLTGEQQDYRPMLWKD